MSIILAVLLVFSVMPLGAGMAFGSDADFELEEGYERVVGDFMEGLAIFARFVGGDFKYGFIDEAGKEVVPVKYDHARDFSDGLAAVELNEKWGFIDKTGKEVIPFDFDYAREFSDGLAPVLMGEKWGFIDKAGKEVVPFKFDEALSFTEGLASVSIDEKFGFIDKTGKEVIAFEYDFAFEFSEGLAAVLLDEKWGFIDKTGEVIIPFDYILITRFSEGLAGVQVDGKIGFVDKTGEVVIPFLYDGASAFKGGVAWVLIGYEEFLIDKTGQRVDPEDDGFVIPVPERVVVSNQPLMIDGEVVEVQPYNIDGSNYFKLRDLAALLTETGSQFDVGFEDGKIVVTTGEAYTPLDTDLVIGEDMSASARPSPQTLVVDGEVVSDVHVYNIGGSNYFQLRELGALVGFAVDYDAETRTMIIETEGY